MTSRPESLSIIPKSVWYDSGCHFCILMILQCMLQIIEPHLQPLSSEALHFKTANSDSYARLDIAANGSGEEGLSVLSLMLEFSTLVHHQIILLSLLIVTMRGRRDVSMSSV